ncbi:MAG: chemotaxis protein chel [Bradyrhizobiaceae bacterium]|nr:MAG: chemotaxis protein chel [Bradyrhizobiaceae bacterium]
MIDPLSLASSALAAAKAFAPAPAAVGDAKARARAAAEDFESVFLGTMFSQMFTDTEGEGPMGAGAGTGIWRSFLTDEYAKSFARAGGIGLADHVARALIAEQEARGR